MPKKVLFSKEVILDTAFRLFKEEGYDAISARNVAKALDSSPAPIYKSIGSMEVLKAELVTRTKKLFIEYLLGSMQVSFAFGLRRVLCEA